ncbi:heterokaryon incompatibility [Pyrenophora seminiperda CCB06]|uniref:Heterokaryon incompatibility n=1 Tax=Pyrenophora seminiperda CCB06 TaxID=1302712 RepID=A0A3M7MCE6_9PLEO|nr:heterokaryon incompatibility [Pyrenophora seminiperda CCB06]
MQPNEKTRFSSPQGYTHFPYRSLNHEDGEDFRLLCLYPGEWHEPVRCDLLHSNIDADIEYEAVSYSWASEEGDDSLSQRISCAYIGEEQTADLLVTSNCASALRRLRLTSNERMLWIDAICIDQTNTKERNNHVELIAKIYSTATQVLVYLGEEDLGFTSQSLWLDSERRQLALKRLFSKRWVSRVWVIQEVALAQKVVMVTGEATCQMDASLMSRIRGRARAYGLQVPGPLSWDPLVSAPTRDLLTLLYMTRGCRSKDPRDKVYGLLGLVGERLQNLIAIDYSQSVEEVLTRTAAAIIICQEDLEILAYASSSLGSRHAANRLPTWAPDWTEHRGDNKLHSQFQQPKIGPWRSLEKLSGSETRAAELTKLDWKAAVYIPSKWPVDNFSSPYLTARAHCLATIHSTMKQDAQDFSRGLLALIGSDIVSKKFASQAWPARYQWLFDPLYARTVPAQHQNPDQLYWTSLEHFCIELDKLGKDKHIFRAGILPAITSHDFQEGDTVWAIDGCTVPLLLRRVKSRNHAQMDDTWSYRIVGNCYLFALSHLDCWATSGTGADQRWDFEPFRHMDPLGTQTIKIY